jgi:predicted kinase
MKTVWIYKGLPASGKSTAAKIVIDKNPGKYKRVNKDDLRLMLDASKWSKTNEKFILRVRDNIIIEALNDGKHVIIDDTNLHPKHEEGIRQLVKNYNSENNSNTQVMVKFFDVNVDECIKRDLQRPKSVGSKVIMDMYNKFIKTEGSNKLIQDKTLPAAIIVDVDGTLADKGDRSPFQWDKVGEDTVKNEIKEIVTRYKADTKIIIFTGRDGVCEPETKAWLKEHDIHFDLLYIRPKGNMEKDSIIKRKLFDDHIRNKYFVRFVLDDRNQVVDMWRKELGLVCLQVDYGDF